MPRDSSDIDSALIAVLQNDATLKTLLPDGIYMDLAAPNLKKFGIVSLVIAQDFAAFGDGSTGTRRGLESVIYLVKAVMLATSGGNVKQAAARIDELLEDKPLTVPGYGWMAMHREERVRYTEVDEIDSTIRWQHRGGRYRVQMAVV